MITLNLNINKDVDKVSIRDEVLFNAILSKNKSLIKKLIKTMHPFYKISDAFFDIVNTYVDFTKDGVSLYAGLIIRVGIDRYVALYLEDVTIDEDYLVHLVDEYIRDIGDHIPKVVNIDKIEIKKKVFLNLIKNL